MNTDKETVRRVANTLALHCGYVDEPHPAALLRELLRERDELFARLRAVDRLAKDDNPGHTSTREMVVLAADIRRALREVKP